MTRTYFELYCFYFFTLQTMEIGDVTCKRFMKRMDSEV